MTQEVFNTQTDISSVLQVIDEAMPLKTIETYLDRTSLSADAKSALVEFARYSIIVGGKVIELGRKILSFAIEIAKIFPNTLLGVALALAITSLIAGVPVVGGLLAGFLKSILLIFGISQGALADMRGGEIGSRLENFVAQFSPLEGIE